MAWYFQKKSTKKATKSYSYGFKRLSLLSAIMNSIVLLIGSIFIIAEAVPRIINPEVSDAKGMMWFAILGIIVNGAAVFKLKKGNSINERVVSLHLLEDVLGWTAVLIASILMQFWIFPMIDPILSILITMFILYNVFKNGKESVRIILQGTPLNISADKIQHTILELKDVADVHDCHLWTMDGEYNILTIHIVIKEFSDAFKMKALKQKVRKTLFDNFHLSHVTIELESSNENCTYINCIS